MDEFHSLQNGIAVIKHESIKPPTGLRIYYETKGGEMTQKKWDQICSHMGSIADGTNVLEWMEVNKNLRYRLAFESDEN